MYKNKSVAEKGMVGGGVRTQRELWSPLIPKWKKNSKSYPQASNLTHVHLCNVFIFTHAAEWVSEIELEKEAIG